jgi:hypothetical protein
MPKTMHLYRGMLDPPDRLAAVTDMAALYELVLIGAHHLMVGGRLAVLRQALAPRRMVALLIDDDLPGIERAMVDDLLNDGVIPVIVTVGETPAGPLMSWPEDYEPCAGTDHHGQRCTERLTRQRRRRRLASPDNHASGLRPAV